jgi:centrosomal protein CEP120
VGIKDEAEQVIGNIRVKVYLEDLGKKAPGVVLAEPQSTDYQAAWELEMWRRAEEAKWKATLKDKENLHLAEVTDQYRTQESERSKSFQKAMTELHQQDARMRAMMIDLQNREQRLLGLEEELKLKMNDSMRQITTKEEECASLRSRMTEQRNESNKKIAALNGEIAKYRDDLSKNEDEMRKARREQDSPQVLHLQKELAAQTLQSAELQRKLDSANAQKEKYRQQCEGVKASLSKLNAQYQEEKKAWESREREELTRFRLMAGAQVSSEEARELQEVKQGLAQLQQTIPSQTLKPPSLPPPDNSLRAPVAYNKSLATQSTPAYSAGNKLVQLREERQRLLEEGYGYDDPLILEFDAQITSLSSS